MDITQMPQFPQINIPQPDYSGLALAMFAVWFFQIFAVIIVMVILKRFFYEYAEHIKKLIVEAHHEMSSDRIREKCHDLNRIRTTTNDMERYGPK